MMLTESLDIQLEHIDVTLNRLLPGSLLTHCANPAQGIGGTYFGQGGVR